MNDSNIASTPFGPPRWEDAADRLMPRLRSGAYVDQLELLARAQGEPNLRCHMPLTDGVHVTLVIDDADTMTQVTTRMLNAWGRSFHETCEHAVDNLRAASRDKLMPIADGVWVAPWRDAYAASRVLLAPDELTPGAASRDLLVSMPDRDTLLIADRGAALAVEALVLAIEQTSGDGLPITRRIFRWRARDDQDGLGDARLMAYDVPRDHAASVLHRNLVVEERMRRYADQHWPLQQVVGDHIYVARAEADEAPDGALVSRALWTERVETLLPEVDRVHLLETHVDGTSSTMWVANFDALLALPDMLTRARCHLPRWHTERFPNAQELQQIGTHIERDRRTAELDSRRGLESDAPDTAPS